MTSPAEHLISKFSFSAFRRAKQLNKGLLFLLFAFAAMRLGSHIPLPGVDTTAWASSPFAHLFVLF